MTAPRAFLIPTDWGRRPLGRLALVEDGPFQIAGAASPMTSQNELISGTPFVNGGTVDRERDYIGWRVGYSNMAGFYWPGGTGTIIARAAKFVAGQVNFFFGGCLTNDMSTTVSSGNFVLNNSTTGAFGIVGGTVCATSQFDPAANPYFVAKSIQSSRADMAAYNHSGRLLKAFSRTGISGQTFAAGQVTSCYFGGPNSAQSRNGALTEMVVLVGGLQLEEMHAAVGQFYGLFFRPLVERTFFVPAPTAAPGGQTASMTAGMTAGASLAASAATLAALSAATSAGETLVGAAGSQDAQTAGLAAGDAHAATAASLGTVTFGATTSATWSALAGAFATLSDGSEQSMVASTSPVQSADMSADASLGAGFTAVAAALAGIATPLTATDVMAAVAAAVAQLTAGAALGASWTAEVNLTSDGIALYATVSVVPALQADAYVGPALTATVEVTPALRGRITLH